ncbi:MAG TPA: nucleotidyltransferase domain-containing protein [Polyangiaceae bacterium]|nr:nucleotidyltransferase domain-containing protein [Polyangiaceae bacterium]
MASRKELDGLSAALAEGPRLRLAVLFGSRATGREHGESDFDIGVFPVDADLSLREELSLASALSSVAGREVDVVASRSRSRGLDRKIRRSGRNAGQNRPFLIFPIFLFASLSVSFFGGRSTTVH